MRCRALRSERRGGQGGALRIDRRAVWNTAWNIGGAMAAIGAASVGAFVSPAFAADTHYDEGVAAAKAGDLGAARAAYEACIAANDPQVADCQWELGWVHWRRGDWDRVVSAWEAVQRLDPKRDKLARSLAEARGNQAGVARMRAALAAKPPPPAVPTAPGQTLRLRAVGDIMLGTLYPEGYLPPDDGAHLLDAVAPALRDAELTFGNLEGPLCDEGTSEKCAPDATNCYAFHVPSRYGRYLKDAGFDLLSMANNHINDFGPACRDASGKTLDSLGIIWSGTPGSIGTLRLAGGQTVALVAFHTNPQSNDVNQLEVARQLVGMARQSHNFVVVSFHGGAEGRNATHVKDGAEMFLGENRGDLKTFTHAMVDAGADVVLGHGPHVLRGMEVYRGHLIAYSLGNFATYGRFNLSTPMNVTAVVEATLDAKGLLQSGRVVSVIQEGRGVPALDAAGAGLTMLKDLSAEDFPSSAPVFAADGSFTPPR
jgi:poly-gamma-glutamate capsule biosynthesis protein CapA/YwtB (metallophosphatase superfamily)